MIRAGCPDGECRWQGRRAVELSHGKLERLFCEIRARREPWLARAPRGLPAELVAQRIEASSNPLWKIADTID